ncbi:hypothetical protein AAHB37_11540 [Glutamicibacter halophytocola]|uniref:hypothetical protein n=1 Tax=Glutamicibacter halophytocola TaxID=1933880 RepID=UPI00321A022B
MSSTAIDTAKKRMRFVLILSVTLLVIILARLVWVQGINAATVANAAQQNREREEVIAPMRGSIEDRNGTTLAVSVDRYDLVIDQREQNEDIRRAKRDGSNGHERISWDQAIQELAKALDQDPEELAKKVRPQGDAKPKGYVVLAKSVTPEVRNEVREIGIPRLSSLLRGERQYPQGVIAGPLARLCAQLGGPDIRGRCRGARTEPRRPPRRHRGRPQIRNQRRRCAHSGHRG